MSEPIANKVLPVRVLLIEDDPVVLVSTAQALRLAGFEVETFGSAESARAMSASRHRSSSSATSACPA